MKKYMPPILWMAVIFMLSSIPGEEFLKMPFPGFDKLVHIILYSILGFLWSKALAPISHQSVLTPTVSANTDVHRLPDIAEDREKKGLGGRIYPAVLIGIVYGLLDEFHQLFVPFREFSLLDLLSDAAGVIIGVLCQLSLKRSRSGN